MLAIATPAFNGINLLMSMSVANIGGLEEIFECIDDEDMVYDVGRRRIMAEQEGNERKRKEMLNSNEIEQGYLCHFTI